MASLKNRPHYVARPRFIHEATAARLAREYAEQLAPLGKTVIWVSDRVSARAEAREWGISATTSYSTRFGFVAILVSGWLTIEQQREQFTRAISRAHELWGTAEQLAETQARIKAVRDYFDGTGPRPHFWPRVKLAFFTGAGFYPARRPPEGNT